MVSLEGYMQVLKSICEENVPGKKTVQKLMYLMERKGVNLGLYYKIHFFGPYSVELDNVLRTLQNNDYIDINTTGVTHTIHIKEVSEYDALTEKEKDAVSYVINMFGKKSALELEGITTVDYIACSFEQEEVDDLKIIEGVKRIKGTKFTGEQLFEYLSVLKEYGFLN